LNTIVSYIRLVVFFTFSFFLLLAISVMVLLKPGTDAYWGPAEVWIRGTLRIFGVKLRVAGLDKLDPDTTYVVMANHRSQLDPVAMGVAVLPRHTRWVAKQELRRVPVLGQALALTGQIFIDRSDTSSAVRSLAEHRRDRDALICFFPEGHRSSTRELLPFKKGAAAFAISAGLPVLPMAVSGSEKVIANRSIMSRPGTITIAMGTPIDTKGMTDDDRGALTERVQAELREMLDVIEGPATPRPEKSAQAEHDVALAMRA
jgi:1-acyl-sn-glycerol-3-phosphate acyltransferase